MLMATYHLPQWQMADLPPITTNLSDFREFREEQFVFVDKTALICNLIRESKVSLYRPRRFGKTLLLSTIRELYTNGTKNFEGLAIHDLWQRPCCPVISLSLFGLSNPETFEQDLCALLRDAFAQAGFVDALSIKTDNIIYLTAELDLLRGQQDIVILVDECDFPLSANLNNPEAFARNQEILRVIYAWERDLDNLECIMFTGIGRYQESSLFSGQDIEDISLEPLFANLLGYTQDELESYFAPHISAAASLLKISEEQLLDDLKRQYYGFCFDRDAEIAVYNPIDINNFFKQVIDYPESVPILGFYWMNSANAAPLMHKFLERNKTGLAFLDAVKGQGVEICQCDLNNVFTFNNKLNFPVLMTQTGYFSIKQVINDSPSSLFRTYACSFPNLEIELAYAHIFVRYLTQSHRHHIEHDEWLRQAAENLRQALDEQDMAQVVAVLNVLLNAIPYDLRGDAKEVAYRTFIGWCLQSSAKRKVRSDALNNSSSADLEFTLNDCSYVIELKLLTQQQQQDPQNAANLAAAAQQQVYDRGYDFNDQDGSDTKHYGLALVVSENSRQIEYWRYFDGTHVIAESAVAPVSMENSPEQFQ